MADGADDDMAMLSHQLRQAQAEIAQLQELNERMEATMRELLEAAAESSAAADVAIAEEEERAEVFERERDEWESRYEALEDAFDEMNDQIKYWRQEFHRAENRITSLQRELVSAGIHGPGVLRPSGVPTQRGTMARDPSTMKGMIM